ncbi:MAG: DNA-formamidopyrimidine glycosylase [Thermoleophilia bacterium]|nr:DNA-formamidopyrimidine glycosylase [Thermoleophilia bacterium]
MPELPEVEIITRVLSEALAGRVVETARAPGLNVMRTFQPKLGELTGRTIEGLDRRGKLFMIHFEGDLHLLGHLMSAGRLNVHAAPAGPRDRSSRLLLRLAGSEEELRLRETGTKQAAWVKLYDGAEALAADPQLATLGPDAWPEPPADLRERLAATGARPLYSVLRDQRVIAGIGRTWVDEILWSARLSPFQRATELDDAQDVALRGAIAERLDAAIAHFASTAALPLPDKLKPPLQVHRRDGEPCPRCGTTIAAVHYESYVMCYCPQEQTGGRVLKDRRLSRLLK